MNNWENRGIIFLVHCHTKPICLNSSNSETIGSLDSCFIRMIYKGQCGIWFFYVNHCSIFKK